MDYALQLLLPILGGLMLGIWLTQSYGVNPIWTVVLAVLGMVGGIGVIYKRTVYPQRSHPPSTADATSQTSQNAAPSASPATKTPPDPPALSLHELGFLYEPPEEGNSQDDDDANETFRP